MSTTLIKVAMYSKFLVVALLFAAAPGWSQTSETRSTEQEPNTPSTTPGRVSESAIGEAGQRQTREKAVEGIAPMARIANRVENRIQSRIPNRIDRSYDPLVNATSSVEAARYRTRTSGQPKLVVPGRRSATPLPDEQ